MNEKNALYYLELELRNLLKSESGRRAFLKATPLLLAGCASTSKTRYREGDNSGQETSITVADEKKMTREYLPQMQKEYPTYKNERVQRYIQSLGRDIAASSKVEGNPYHYKFRVVESKHINAFALPAGEVFVTAPLIKLAESEAELAGVVGHEIGHIQARHTAERIDKANKQKGKSLLYGLGGLIIGGAAGYGLGKALCSKGDKACLKRAAKYGALAGGAGGLLIQKFAFMANSREDEMEADRIGFRTSVAAGFHKDYVGNFYNKLYQMEKGRNKGLMSAFSDALSTHPPSQERVAQMNQLSESVALSGKLISSNAFKSIKRMI